MKLATRFLQIPLQFDAELLAHEVGGVDTSAWLSHPQGFAGNDYLPLVTAGGDPRSEGFMGPMRPTPHLLGCPHLIDVLASLGVVVGRTRLMRLSGNAEVKAHIDVHYYWRDRMRVHVPIVTQPSVRFICGDQEVNMGPGECWIFDTWAWHRVLNDAVESRIHLVVDTVGGDKFSALMARGRKLDGPAGWAATPVAPLQANIYDIDFERVSSPVVMTPWEVNAHLEFLLSETDESQRSAYALVSRALEDFKRSWRMNWSTFGADSDGWPRYRQALDTLAQRLNESQAASLKLKNGYGFIPTLNAMVMSTALSQK